MDFETTYSAVSRLTEDLEQRGFEKLPAERHLAERLNTSRSVVRRVLDRLEQEQRIRRVRGRSGGAYLVLTEGQNLEQLVSQEELPALRRFERPLDVVLGIPQMLGAQGFESGTRVVSTGFEHPDEVEQEFFGIGADDLVVVIVRLRFADGDTLSLESFHVPAGRFPGLLDQPLTGSLYELVAQKYGVRATRAYEEICVTQAAPRVAAVLETVAETPLLRVSRLSEDQFGNPFERSIDLFRTDRTVLVATPGQPVRDRHRSSVFYPSTTGAVAEASLGAPSFKLGA